MNKIDYPLTNIIVKNSLAVRHIFLVVIFVSLLLTNLVSRAQDYLFGLTQNGGAGDLGVAYRINTDGTGYTVIKHFDGVNGGRPGNGSGFVQYSNYLGTPGEAMAALTPLGDGGFGTRISGNITSGTVGWSPGFGFTVDGTGTNPEGRFLWSALRFALYGMTPTNGAYNGGAIFFSSQAYVGLRTVVSFDGVARGRSPKGSLIEGTDGALYGMTELGGVYDMGVIFSFDQVFTKIFDFDGAATGANPTGNLLMGSDGKLYGMTKKGGTSDNGVIFRINTDGTGFAKIMDFNGLVTGSSPLGSLVQFTDGKLYGLTSSGGAYGYGTIFSITVDGQFTKILDFDGPNGKSPVGDLIVGTSGDVMYGVAFSGGSNDMGVLFKLERGTQYTKLYDFSEETGANPVGTLLMKRKLPDFDFPPMEERTILSPPFTPVVNSSSGLQAYFISENKSIAVIENNQVKPVALGGVYISAFHPGNHEYLTERKRQGLMVGKANQTIDFPPIQAKTYGDAPFTLPVTASSGLPLSYYLSPSDVLSFNGSHFSIKGAGRVTIRAFQQGNDTYKEASAERVLIVERGEQIIDFNLTPQRICCQPFDLSASSSGGTDVKFKTPDWEKLEIYGKRASIHGLGTIEIIAYNEGNRNYKPAEKSATLNVTKGYQFMTFNVPEGPFKLGDPDVYISNTYTTEGLPITYTSDPPGIAVVEKSFLKFIGVGTTTITATQNGNDLTSAATPIARTITIDPPAIPGNGNSITWTDNLAKHTLDPPFNLTAGATSGLPVSFVSSNPEVAEVSGNLVTIKKTGTTTITASQRGTLTIPAAAPVQKELTVVKRHQYAILPDVSLLRFDAAAIQMPSRSSGGLLLNYSSSNESVAYVDSDYLLRITGTGKVKIGASQPGDENYLPASPVYIDITIQPLFQSLSFDPLQAKTFGDEPFPLTASASSGLPVVFTSSDPEKVSIDGTIATIHGAGTVDITATQTGVPGYQSVHAKQQLVISKASQVIDFPELPQKKFNDNPFTITATASSGLPLTFSSANAAVVKVSGNKISINGTGAVEIIALQEGNENYLPAEARRTLEIADADLSFEIIGATTFGGVNKNGTIYSIKSDGTMHNLLRQFEPRTSPSPMGGFIKGTDGKLYGNFNRGGAHNLGSIVRLEADGTGLTRLYDYDNASGSSPYGNLFQGTDGGLYGMTYNGGQHSGGTIVRINPDGTGFKVLHHFFSGDGTLPYGGVVEAANGRLYGMTSSDGLHGLGTIFSMNKDGSDFVVLFSFNEDDPVKSGFSPRGDLIEGPDGYLYGTLPSGGEELGGILFKINPDGSDFRKLVIFKREETGAYPVSTPLIGSDGRIYGTCSSGRTRNDGVIYSLETDGTDFVRVFDFDGSIMGISPSAKLTEGNDGLLYGMTNVGGTYSRGTIFKVGKDGAGYRTLANLSTSASSPYYGPLLETTTGAFIGMTSAGGFGNGGTIFRITSEGDFKILNQFPEQESSPSVMISDESGEFYYGIAARGGESGVGSIFRINSSGVYQTLYPIPDDVMVSRLYYVSTGHLWVSGFRTTTLSPVLFRINTDDFEHSSLTEIVSNIKSQVEWLAETPDGKVLGSTAYGNGIFFSVNNDGTGFTRLADKPSGVEFLSSSYMYASDDNVYAVTGYSHEFYRLTRSGSFTKIADLPDEIGQVPVKLMEFNGGRIGVIMRDLAIFSIEKDGSSYAKIFIQATETGSAPSDMVQTLDGWIYVSASSGGANSKGVLYKIRPDGSSYTKVHDFNGEDGDSPNSILFVRKQSSINFDPIPAKKLTDPSFLPVASATSGARIEFTSSDPLVATIEEGKIRITGVGSTTITASVPANANYFEVPGVQRTLVVEKGSQTIEFTSIADQQLGNPSFELQATSTSGLPVYFTTNSNKISIDGSMVKLFESGKVQIEASQPGDERYEPAPIVTHIFCVNPPDPDIGIERSLTQVTLVSSNSSGNQWYLDGEILEGATGKNLPDITVPGSYTVVTSVEGCTSSVSEPYVHVVTGIDSDPEMSVKAYPNPVSEEVFVEFSGPLHRTIKIELIDDLGRTVSVRQLTGKGVVTFDLRDERSGLYLLKAMTGSYLMIRKLIKL